MICFGFSRIPTERPPISRLMAAPFTVWLNRFLLSLTRSNILLHYPWSCYLYNYGYLQTRQSGLLSLIWQHSIDYWLWADLIAPESERLLKNVARVHKQEEADVFYIPFFTTISFFLLEKQQCKALYRVWVRFLSFTLSHINEFFYDISLGEEITCGA